MGAFRRLRLKIGEQMLTCTPSENSSGTLELFVIYIGPKLKRTVLKQDNIT